MTGASEEPPVTFVTPCLNRAKFVEQAIESVLRQGLADFEHIVVDGGSTDGTLDILERYPHLRVISEPDEGVYDALNKGIRMAGGDIIGLLNSDDVYEDDVLGDVIRCFQGDPGVDGVFGGASVFEDGSFGRKRIIARYNDQKDKDLSFRNITIGVPITNARFFRKRVYERIGLFDTRFRIASDREFLLRAALANLKCVRLNTEVYGYRQHRGSLTIQNKTPYILEKSNEYIEIASTYMHRTTMPPEGRKYCRIWHAKTILEMAIRGLFRMRLTDTRRYLAEGWDNRNAWPAGLISLASLQVSYGRASLRRRRVPQS
jgi:glycosyltransferase involved in cell wall biosynthesis